MLFKSIDYFKDFYLNSDKTASKSINLPMGNHKLCTQSKDVVCEVNGYRC